MNEPYIYQIALIGNAIVTLGSMAVAFKYYFAVRELHLVIGRQDEVDGLRYAQNFQTQLWNEKKESLEKELAAYKEAHKKVSLELIDLTERFNGLEKAYHEAREDLRASGVLMSQAQAEENKRKRKRVG
jgi:hypothetical protein